VAVAGRFARKGEEVNGTLKMPQSARRRRGVTLIEAVLYVAVALALIVGGLVFYKQASLQSRTNSVVRAYSALIAEARAMMAEGNSIPTTSNLEELLFARGSIPAGLWDATKPLGQRIRLPFQNMYASLGGTLLPGNSNISLVQVNLPISRLLK
jgi:type II secretory pathway pseudopilin PulG